MSASVVTNLFSYKWNDKNWMKKRTDCKESALNIYEVHLGSWRKKSDDTWYSYKEIAEPLISYVKEKGYNYIEIMPIAEHPCDNSWGYQQTGFYSPTARYGAHDEVVHGKATIVQKMNGEYKDKFPQARTLYMYMYAHPGKKLNFMGNEIGQLREWDEKREQDWDILKYPVHDSFSRYMKDLCFVYQNNPALFELDYEQAGFKWIDCHQEKKCLYVFERIGKKQRILTILYFSDTRQTYQIQIV